MKIHAVIFNNKKKKQIEQYRETVHADRACTWSSHKALEVSVQPHNY